MKSVYFNDEIPCNCSCGIANINKAFSASLDRLREYCGFPIYANSICRCPRYNVNEGGSETSSHISTEEQECTAADLRLPDNSTQRYIFMKHVLVLFDRIGMSIKDDFVHVDMDQTKPSKLFWVYRRK